MNNRLIEYGNCYIGANSALGLQRFDGRGLALDTYRRRLEDRILPDACEAFPDTAGIVDVIRKDGESVWDLEPSARDSGDVKALSMDERQALGEEITALVGGSVVVHGC
jgi:hypothetical protein